MITLIPVRKVNSSLTTDSKRVPQYVASPASRDETCPVFSSHNSTGDLYLLIPQTTEVAKARGVHLGRPIKKPPENFPEVVKLWERGKITFEEALEQTGLKQGTFYNRLREFRSNKKK